MKVPLPFGWLSEMGLLADALKTKGQEVVAGSANEFGFTVQNMQVSEHTVNDCGVVMDPDDPPHPMRMLWTDHMIFTLEELHCIGFEMGPVDSLKKNQAREDRIVFKP